MKTNITVYEKPDYGWVIVGSLFVMTIFVFVGHYTLPNHTVSNIVTIIGTLLIFIYLHKRYKNELEKVESYLFKESLKKHNSIIDSCLRGNFKDSESLVNNRIICDRFITTYPDKRFLMEMLYNLKISSVINIFNESPKIRNFIKTIFLDDFEKRLHYRIFLDQRTIIELIKKNVLHEILRNKVRKGL